MAYLTSVILPCFNERGNILALIEAIHHELRSIPHEIVVVDDNSPDGTFQCVQDKNAPYIRAFLRNHNPSLALSIRKGLEEARGDILIVMDSDFNHNPGYLTLMIKNLEFFDCVSGSRFVYGGKMDKKWRHLFSWIFNIWVRLLTGKYITDSLYGFFAIKSEVLKKLDFDKIFWGYGDYCIRLMYYLQDLNASILQFPAVNGVRMAGTGNNHFFRILIQYTKATLKLAFQIKKNKSHEQRY
jgi:dolichol-phosphate mannosyltransferase